MLTVAFVLPMAEPPKRDTSKYMELGTSFTHQFCATMLLPSGNMRRFDLLDGCFTTAREERRLRFCNSRPMVPRFLLFFLAVCTGVENCIVWCESKQGSELTGENDWRDL